MERISRLCAVTFVVVGGLVHLQLWRSGYKGIPSVGNAFLVNVALAGVLALALVVRNDWRVNVAGVVFSAGSIGALVMSRTVGFLGFTERAWTGRAVQATTAEIGAIVAFALVAVATRRSQPELRDPFMAWPRPHRGPSSRAEPAGNPGGSILSS